MGILEKLFGKKDASAEVRPAAGFKTITEYQPYFDSWNGDMYEQMLVRACIERIALACEKLKPEVVGTARPRIARAFETSPSAFMTWPRFLARCATIYYNDTNLFIVPAYKPGTDIVTGIYPLKPAFTEVVEYAGEPWFRFHTPAGDTLAIEASKVCLVTRFQYESDYFGGGNDPLDATLGLMRAQEQAQRTAMQNGAAIRFIGALNGQVREEDMEKKRDRFTEQNLSTSNTSGLMLYDATFNDVKQVEPKSWTIDASQMQRIRDDVFCYFGMNEAILTNSYDENQWGAFYEGVVEPFAVQLGEGLSQMLYTMRERPKNKIEFSSSRLEYSSNSSKRNMNRDMLDRGVITLNDAREILQLPPVEGGDVFILRGEYMVATTVDDMRRLQELEAAAAGKIAGVEWADVDRDAQDADLDRGDSEGYGHGGDHDSGTGGNRAD